MKYIKLMAFLLGAVGLASCSSDDDKVEYNNAKGVTVAMEYAELNFMESSGIVNVPVKVTGESNGYITVACSVEEIGGNPAMSDVHYYVTDETINIATGDSIGNFELRLVDDFEINESRSFLIKITDVDGATLDGIAQTIVTLDDNDDKPYDRLAGEWYCACDPTLSGTLTVKTITIKAYLPGEYGYGYSYQVYGFFNDPTIAVQMMFNYNESTQEGDCQIVVPQAYKFDGQDGNWELAFLSDDLSQQFTTGKAVFAWNEDVSELTLIQDPDNSGHVNMMIWDQGESYKQGQYIIADFVFNVSGLTREMPKL